MALSQFSPLICSPGTSSSACGSWTLESNSLPPVESARIRGSVDRPGPWRRRSGLHGPARSLVGPCPPLLALSSSTPAWIGRRWRRSAQPLPAGIHLNWNKQSDFPPWLDQILFFFDSVSLYLIFCLLFYSISLHFIIDSIFVAINLFLGPICLPDRFILRDFWVGSNVFMLPIRLASQVETDRKCGRGAIATDKSGLRRTKA